MKKIVYGSPDVITEYCYDGDQVIAEYQGGSQKIVYVYGAGIDEPIFMYNYDISKGAFYHFDGLGNVIALSNLTGDLEERYSYDVFGEPNRTSSIGNPYLFTGRQYDNETGLYYYRARYYSPAIGRFLQADPIGYKDGLNLHTYVHNNPVNNLDPDGLMTFSECVHRHLQQRAAARRNFVSCMVNSCGAPSTIGASLGGCAVLCSRFASNPYALGACFVTCTGITNIGSIFCIRVCTRILSSALHRAENSFQRCIDCGEY